MHLYIHTHIYIIHTYVCMLYANVPRNDSGMTLEQVKVLEWEPGAVYAPFQKQGESAAAMLGFVSQGKPL